LLIMSDNLNYWSVATSTINVYLQLSKLNDLFVSVYRILI